MKNGFSYILIPLLASFAPKALAAEKFIIEASPIVEPPPKLSHWTKQQSLFTKSSEKLPQLSATSTGSSGSSSTIFVRGAPANQVKFLQNGIDVADPSLTTRTPDFATLNNSSADEVFFKNDTLAFGPEVGGIIAWNNICETNSEEAGLTVGSYQTLSVFGQIKRAKDKKQLCLFVEKYQTEGFSDSAAGSEKDGFDLTHFHARGQFDLTGTVTAKLGMNFSDSTKKLDLFGFDDPNNSIDKKLWTADLSFTQKGEFWQQTLGGYFTYHKYNNQNPPDSPGGPIFQDDVFVGKLYRAHWDHELFLGPKNTLRTGVSVLREEADVNSESSFSGLVTQYDFDKNITTLGAYLEDEDSFTDIHIKWGVRGDKQDKNQMFSYFLSSSLQNHFVIPHLLVKSGGRFPSLFQLYSQFGNANLKTERALSYEIGLEKTIGSNWGMDVTYFETYFDDLIDFEFTSLRYDNIAKAKNRGLQGELKYQSPSFTQSAHYNYLEAKNLDTGNRLLRRPTHSASLHSTVTLNSYNFGLGFKVIGSRLDINTTGEEITLPSYQVVDLHTSKKWNSGVELGFQIKNLLDEKYQSVFGYNTERRNYLASIKVTH